MDAADRAILKALVKNARTPMKDLAKEAYLSAPATSARVSRLEESGVIRGYQTVLDPQMLGYQIMAFVNVAVSPDRRPAFRELLLDCPNVLECHHVTGNYSLILKVAFPNTRELDSFVGRLQEFGTTQTQVVFSTLVEPRQITE